MYYAIIQNAKVLFFFPKISLDIYYFLDFLTFNFLYTNWLDLELLVRNTSQLSTRSLELAPPACHWAELALAWGGLQHKTLRFWARLNFSGCLFIFVV